MRFLITKGSFKQGEKYLKEGEVIELTEEDALLMDPDGICLKSAEAAEKDAKKAAAAASAADEDAKKLKHKS